MSIFKINIKPIVKDRNYNVTYVHTGKKEKTCATCKKTIKIGYPATTFLKRVSVGVDTKYNSQYTCGNRNTPCTQELAKQLNVELP